MRGSKRAGLGALALVAVGCGSQGGTATYTGTQISDYVATWDGYAEAFTFEDGSDRLRLTLSTDGHGFLQVGDAPLLAPPTDPSVGYPPSPWIWSPPPLGSELKPGFAYPLYDARVETARLRFAADYHDVYTDWCAMQTPYLLDASASPPSYACVPNAWNLGWNVSADGKSCTMVDLNTGQPVPVDCVQAWVCTEPVPCDCDSAWLCQYDANSCWTPPPANGVYPVQIDGALENAGANLVGTLAMNDGRTRFTIRLTRQ